MNTQAAYVLFFGCPYPRNVSIMYLIYVTSLLALFQNFSDRTYKSETKNFKNKEV